jgi:hypothetical protein
MNNLRQAAQQALEALEGWDNYGKWVWPESALEQAKRNTTESLTALRTALAEQQQEPVAWMVYTLDGKSVCVTDNPADFTDGHRALPLYTTPPAQPAQRQPLTDEQIDAIWDRAALQKLYDMAAIRRNIARAIEAAHGVTKDQK